jgi:dTDP-4-dehydrorhamnose reductase
MAPRYLIIGASGVVGARLYAMLGPENALATYCKRRIPNGIAFDAARMRLADAVLKRQKGLTHAFVMHGMTSIDACARNPLEAAKVNVESVCAVTDDLVYHGIVPVFVSSDAVFDGTRGMWTEEDVVNPILTYGRQKIQVERHLMRMRHRWTVARLAKVVTIEPDQGDILGEWMGKLEAGATIRCARDQLFSPVLLDNAVRALIRLAEGGLHGLFHLCGPRAMTRLELLETIMAEVGKYRPTTARVIPCTLRDLERELGWAERRPVDTSMSPRKLYDTLGTSFDDMSSVCRAAAARRYGAGSMGVSASEIRREG